MIKPYFQRIRPYPLGQPTLTYSKEGITFKVSGTSDMLMETIRWSVNSTGTDFRNEICEGYRNGGEYTENNWMYAAVDDKVFVK
ncbi:MAG TPA: hypothetical protein VF141_02260 [Chryseolinea sp.]